MAPGHVFKFYKPPYHKENVPAGPQSTEGASSSTRVRAFRNLTPADLAPKQPYETPFKLPPPPPRAIPSACAFKIHPTSTLSANPVKLGDCSNTSPPRLDANPSTFANLTSTDVVQGLQNPPPKKSFVKHEKVKIAWASIDEAKAWMGMEEQDRGFKFVSKGCSPPRGAAVAWTMKLSYVCSRGASGGKKVYVKKTDRTTKKISQRATGCRCALRLTLYPDRVEGSYIAAHNHPLGEENGQLS